MDISPTLMDISLIFHRHLDDITMIFHTDIWPTFQRHFINNLMTFHQRSNDFFSSFAFSFFFLFQFVICWAITRCCTHVDIYTSLILAFLVATLCWHCNDTITTIQRHLNNTLTTLQQHLKHVMTLQRNFNEHITNF